MKSKLCYTTIVLVLYNSMNTATGCEPPTNSEYKNNWSLCFRVYSTSEGKEVCDYIYTYLSILAMGIYLQCQN